MPGPAIEGKVGGVFLFFFSFAFFICESPSLSRSQPPSEVKRRSNGKD